MSKMNTVIAGVSYRQDGVRWLERHKIGEHRLLLVPEPDNKHDKNAIKVLTTGGMMLGYVPAVDAPRVGEYLRNRDVLVRCYKTSESFASIRIEFIKEDPLS